MIGQLKTLLTICAGSVLLFALLLLLEVTP